MALNLDGDVDAGRQIELLQLVHRLGGWFEDVEQALVRPLLEGLHRLLVDVGRAMHGEALDAGGKRNGTGDAGACPLDRLHDVCLLYTSDAADERSSVDLGGRRI